MVVPRALARVNRFHGPDGERMPHNGIYLAFIGG